MALTAGREAAMPEPSNHRKEFGYYIALAQVGMEMAAPIGLGLVLDYYLKWAPWGVIGGAVVGLVGGFAHLVALVNRRDNSQSSNQQRDVS
jgi:F0F1-type ATP synthase assembly protein I